MLPRAWQSWSVRSTGLPNSGTFWPTNGEMPSLWARAVGVGAAMQEQVLAALASQAAVVLDADALTSFAEEPGKLASAIGKRPGQDVVITPHEEEFYRIFNNILKKPNLNSKLEKTRLAADYCGAVVVHKGADTVVAAPGGRAAIADNGPPSLATAGSGDVLAGIVAGLMA